MTNRESSIYIFAMRYALARETGASLFVSQEIIRNWGKFDANTQTRIKEEIEMGLAVYNYCNSDWQSVLDLENKNDNNV